MKTLFLSPLQLWGGGGRGGIPASFPSRSPPPKQPFQPTPTPSPGSHQEVCEKIVFGPWVRVSKRYHNRQSADLGGPWMVSEGGAVQFHEGGFRLRSSISAAGGPQAPENLANKPLSPASRSRIPKMPRCSSAHEKPALLHRLISCAQSLQPSLPFLLRRNNKVQGARS